jgi:hypothetical protein
MRVWRLIGAVMLALALTACASGQMKKEPPTGPTAILGESSQTFGPKIGQASQRVGFDRFTPVDLDVYYEFKTGYYLPAGRPITVKVKGRRGYLMPIVALVSNLYEIEGEVTFTPVADHHYMVTGLLSEERSAVWIEDTTTSERVGDAIEVEGSTAIGIFEK